jgi:hypothetical protein
MTGMRDCSVMAAIRLVRQQNPDRLAVGGRDELHRRLRQPGGGHRLGDDARERRVGRERFGTALQDHCVAGFEAEARGVGGHVGARFVDHADDADRHADLRDVEAVRPLPASDRLPDGIG